MWRSVLAQYENILTLKSKAKSKGKGKADLMVLDKWYQNELPSIIQKRKDMFITKEELIKLMTWKLSRGKFRPALPSLIASNSEESVEEASKNAFQSLPNLSKAIKELSVLRGVGPATASAILAAGSPDQAPFMADESVTSIPSITVLKYDLNCYLHYAEQVKEAASALQEKDPDFQWSPHKCELTLWTYVMMEKLAPEQFEKLQLSEKNNKKRRNDFCENTRALKNKKM